MSDTDRHPFLSGLSKHRGAQPTCVVIFGASGDLAARKLLPALYNLAVDSLLPADFHLIGFGRKPVPDAEFRTQAAAGVARRGVLVRHLVLPSGFSGTPGVLRTLRRLGGPGVWVSLMSQYTPMYRAAGAPGIGRRVSGREYARALAALEEQGIVNGYVQGLSSAVEDWVPDFEE